MRVKIGASALAATLAAFLTFPAAVSACTKCNFVEQGFRCVFSLVSCCTLINGSACESGPCSGGCGGSPYAPGSAPASLAEGAEAAEASCDEAAELAARAAALLPAADPGKRAHSVVLAARR